MLFETSLKYQMLIVVFAAGFFFAPYQGSSQHGGMGMEPEEEEEDIPEQQELPKADYSGNLWGGLGGFFPGWMPFDAGGINTALNGEIDQYLPDHDINFPEIGSSLRKLGGGGGAYIKDFYFGGTGSSFASFGVEDDVKVSLLGGYGEFQVGYAVWHNPSMILTPLIGYAGAGYILEFESDKEPFNGIRNEETEGMHILNFSLKWDFFPMSLDSYSKNGIYIGVQGGYMLNLSNEKWRTNNLPFEKRIPTAEFGGPYIKLSIGGGGLLTDRRESMF